MVVALGRGAEDRRCDVYAREERGHLPAVGRTSALCVAVRCVYRPSSREYERELQKRQRAQWRNETRLGDETAPLFTFPGNREFSSSHYILARAPLMGMHSLSSLSVTSRVNERRACTFYSTVRAAARICVARNRNAR